jgi:hypothetical protein
MQVPQYAWEPHVSESILDNYVSNAGISLRSPVSITSVTLNGTVIQSALLSDGTTVTGSQWIDASYEGDMLHLAGVSYVVAREGRSQYNESYAGWGRQQVVNMSPYSSGNQLWPGIDPNPAEVAGQGDAKIMAYTFRATLTNNASNSTPFPMPSSYNPAQFGALANYIQVNGFTDLTQIVALQPLPNQKFCLLSSNAFSTDYVGGSWGYPDGTADQRSAIVQAHYNYVAGWLYFVANDPSVPARIRSQMAGYGLPLDEFTDNGNWPGQMYVREGRRILGQYIMTQADVVTNTTKPDVIALGNWLIDSHVCEAVATPSGTGSRLDGYLSVTNNSQGWFEIPFSSLLPIASQVSNLAVTFCVSASHVANAAIRVEPTLMMLGEAAGVAAGMAVSGGTVISSVDVTSLQTKLRTYGAILTLQLRLGWPNANDTAIRGWGSIITWAYLGDPGPTLKIDLYKSGEFLTTISPSVPVGSSGKGSYTWIPSSSLAYGSDYSVQITSNTDDTILAKSNGMFRVQPGSIRVVAPHGGENWIRTSRNVIQWAYGDNPGPTVKIELMNESGKAVLTTIATGVPIGSGGVGSFTLGNQLAQIPDGNNYRILITSEANPGTSNWSPNVFTLVDGTVRITAPNGGEDWARGTTQTISWAYGGTINGNVSLYLLLNHVVVATIASSTPHGTGGVGSFAWTLPESLTPGTEYLVRIVGPAGVSVDASDKNFTIQ